MAAPTAERPAAAREPLLGRWRPRSLQSRQLLAASLGLLAFLALAGYALDRAFQSAAENELRNAMHAFALQYAADTDFDRSGELIPPFGCATRCRLAVGPW